MLNRRALRNIDFLFIIVLLLILGASLLILSTASINVDKAHPYHFVELQALWIASGIVLAVLVASFDYQRLQRYSWVIYGVTLVLLIAIFFVGESAKGATRWIPITSSFNLQPSELAKILIIITLADFLSKREGKLTRIRDFILPFLFVIIPILLIFKQPDLGTSLVLVAIFIGMMFVAGANPWKFGGILLGGALIVGIALFLHFKYNMPLPMHDYQLNRLTIFMNPAADTSGDGYHIIQSIWAIGSGGLWGKGYHMGTQIQLNFLPEHHTDFIFSVVGEEFGFIGTITLLFFFFIFLSRAISVAFNAKDMFGTLVATGIISMFIFHILVNVGMTSGIMPVTGIPLPLISYGGNNMWSNMLAVGLLINIRMRSQQLMF